MFGCCIHDGKMNELLITSGASATLENNTITDNDQTGVRLQDHATATLTGNTIKGNGQCKIEWTGEELEEWPEEDVALYHSPDGFPGVHATDHSTITMPPGSNTIEGNSKVGSDGEQVTVDETSKAK
jgi:parallel beta-helix repeat protein